MAIPLSKMYVVITTCILTIIFWKPLLSMWDEKVAQSDLYTSHMRWDYRILTYVLDGTGRLRESYKGTELYRLSVVSI